jgi:hypothetical protein
VSGLSILALLALIFWVATVVQLVARGHLPVRINWRRVVFASALFWSWYLAPRLTQESALASVLSLLVP